MKNKFFTTVIITIFTITLNAQMNIVIHDTFTDTLKFHDLSKLLIWGTNSSITSAFRLVVKTDGSSTSYNAITTTDSAALYLNYSNPSGLRTGTCIDYEFPYSLSRTNDTIKIEFDCLWDQLTTGGNTHRIVPALMYEYPAGGPRYGDFDSVGISAAFGRPAYNWRVLGRTPQGTNNYGSLFYGGGKTILGEFEKFNNTYWLPGFISGPGGISPENALPNYPLSSVMKYTTKTLASTSSWKHYSVIITKTRITWYFRNSNDNESMNETITFIETPEMQSDTMAMIAQLNSAHGTSATSLPVYYNYFNNFKAFRLFMNGPKTYFANVKVSTTQEPVGSKEKDMDVFNIYPNPAKDILWINLKRTALPVQLSITDMTGALIMKENLYTTRSKISLHQIPAGIYLVSISDKTIKLSVNH